MNGFDLAGFDLRLRGAGESLGTRQSGAMRFRFGNIVRDIKLMEKARDLAIEILANDGLAPAEKIVQKLLGTPMSATAKD